jgi:putative addiction module killer protein
MTESKQIEAYVKPDGTATFTTWLKSLRDAEARHRINARLARVRTGNLGDARTVGEGVSELRIDYGPGYRVYFGQDGMRIIVLLCGGDKRTQAADIKRAKSYWQEYQKQKKVIRDE